jgi:two-component system, chemotaxis family, protein-glutamate methylesterase/glutaminase
LTTTPRIRVLIVEDSLFMQQVLQSALEKCPDVEIVGSAKTGAEAISMVRTRKPDVVTLDILLPDVDGLALLRQLVALSLPVIIISNVSLPESAVALQALDMGAIDCVAKPQRGGLPPAAFTTELVAKIREAAAAGPGKVRQMSGRRGMPGPLKMAKTVVVIGASAGGPLLLREIIPRLPPDLAAGVLVVQHMSGQFTKQFTVNIAANSKIRVKEAQPGDAFVEGTVLVAGGDDTVKAEWVSDGVGAVSFSTIGATHFGFRVWIDAAMATASLIYGRRTIGVLLSGMGTDGVEGLRLIRRAGGRSLVQDESTSVVFGMPRAAIEAGMADRVLPVQKIADAIVEEVEALSALKI